VKVHHVECLADIGIDEECICSALDRHRGRVVAAVVAYLEANDGAPGGMLAAEVKRGLWRAYLPKGGEGE
jgi:hypothetical protein